MHSSSVRTQPHGRRASLAVLILAALLSVPLGTTWGAPGDTTRVSVASDGTQANGDSHRSRLNATGRFVAFVSVSSNLVPGDTNNKYDVFVHDRETGTTTRVSVSSAGTQANGNSFHLDPGISADGRFVAFGSDATNLVPSDTNTNVDVFVHDRQTGTTERVSVSSTGDQVAGFAPDISADGRFVAFNSNYPTLIPDDTNASSDVFLHDRQTGLTERVSVSSGGIQGNDDSGIAEPALSADGRFVAFSSGASNLVPGDTNASLDVFVRDRQTGTTERVSIASSGTQGNDLSGGSSPMGISADGRFVAFVSLASNLVPGDTNGVADIFVHDRQTGTTERISVSSTGNQANAFSVVPRISADGRLVVFNTSSSNLVPGDTNGAHDIFVHDRQTGTTERVSVASDGAEANAISVSAAISADGKIVSFQSFATTLVPNDTNGHEDVFIHELDSAPGDAVPPACTFAGTGTDPQGRKVIDIKTQDTGSGLASITVLKQVNSQVPIPSFTVGTTDPVVVRATKLDQTKPSQVQLRVTDVAGNATTCDPVHLLLIREAGQPVTETLTGMPAAEDTVTISNGSPGLSQLVVVVNGVRFRAVALKPNEERTLDIAAALQPGDSNTIELTARGRTGASAEVLIWDGGP